MSIVHGWCEANAIIIVWQKVGIMILELILLEQRTIVLRMLTSLGYALELHKELRILQLIV